ncbi:DUF2358 domain-containing protein [Synechococcus sp. PCC 7336]|uniref:DUF2358 domain-containing protein n=1 Tax=Synechococcus sp. PCC 7336 TaxID=195250 RepID=UPI00034A4D4E|nr:DUF2358 domain-containing protein [Synechococcus sp. PCC 7336]
MDTASLIDILEQDYRRFPQEQTFDIYAEDVYFKDPLNEFRGLEPYRRNIAFIERWFQQPQLDLQAIEAASDRIVTRWILSWTTPLPWKPRIAIAGWSELEVNERGLIQSHIDYWHCSKLNVIAQHFWPQQANGRASSDPE